ncbi:Beta-galactosidase C-terminal domain, partial [Streptomyces ochraceiscleroticus]
GVQATVRSDARARYLFLLNHGQEPAEVALPRPMTDALAQATPRAATVYHLTLPARGVAVLSESGPRAGS